eukprot:7878338-Prorocentrum_lima.AAC.1
MATLPVSKPSVAPQVALVAPSTAHIFEEVRSVFLPFLLEDPGVPIGEALPGRCAYRAFLGAM